MSKIFIRLSSTRETICLGNMGTIIFKKLGITGEGGDKRAMLAKALEDA